MEDDGSPHPASAARQVGRAGRWGRHRDGSFAAPPVGRVPVASGGVGRRLGGCGPGRWEVGQGHGRVGRRSVGEEPHRRRRQHRAPVRVGVGPHRSRHRRAEARGSRPRGRGPVARRARHRRPDRPDRSAQHPDLSQGPAGGAGRRRRSWRPAPQPGRPGRHAQGGGEGAYPEAGAGVGRGPDRPLPARGGEAPVGTGPAPGWAHGLRRSERLGLRWRTSTSRRRR